MMEVSSSAAGTIHWKVGRCGILINPQRVVCIIRPHSSTSSSGVEIRGPSYGSIRVKLVEEGANVSEGTILYIFEPCKHSIVMKDLCAECGANLRKEDGLPGERTKPAAANVAMVHNIPELHVSEQQAHELAREDELNLLKARKLVLLVDLDQTLIHTTITPPSEAFRKDVHCFRLHNHPAEPFMFTHIRPGTQEFLQRISRLFQLHICTFGNRMYAHTIAKLLDPKGTFFAKRILSRNEAFDPQTKTANMKALFPRGERMVCIIDDRDEVWRYGANLIHVKPYHYFQNTGDINDPKLQLQRHLQHQPERASSSSSETSSSRPPDSGATMTDNAEEPSPSSKNNEVAGAEKPSVGDPENASNTCGNEQEERGYLERLFEILEEVHRRYYTQIDALGLSAEQIVALRDQQLNLTGPTSIRSVTSAAATSSATSRQLPQVCDIMNDMRWATLDQCRVLLSGLVLRNAKLKFSRSYNLCRTLGADVHEELVRDGDRTTHVVACVHTHKVKEALHHATPKSEGSDTKWPQVVNPKWLWDCYYYWRRQPETDYSLPETAHFEPSQFEDWVVHFRTGAGSGLIRYAGPQQEMLSVWRSVPSSSNATEGTSEGKSTTGATTSRGDVPGESEPDEESIDLEQYLPKALSPKQMDSNPLLHIAPSQRRSMMREVEEAMADEDDDSSSSSSEVSSESQNEDPPVCVPKTSRSCQRQPSEVTSRHHPRRRIKESRNHNREKKIKETLDSSEEEDHLNPELPKGWRSRKEPSRSWSQAGSSEEDDLREWRSCPEGYDYADAEEAHRALLLRDTTSSSSNDEDPNTAGATESARKRRLSPNGPERKRGRFENAGGGGRLVGEESSSGSEDDELEGIL